MLNELSLDPVKIGVVAKSDNAANMKLGIENLPGLKEQSCDIHTLQLSIRDTFKQVEGMESVRQNVVSLRLEPTIAQR